MENKLSGSLLLILLSFAVISFGQETTGSVKGTVKDSSGAVIPGVTVIVSGKGFNKTTTTDDEGFYEVKRVPAGIYTVEANTKGFEVFKKEDVQVKLGVATQISPVLKAGGAEVTVEVSVNPQIDPASSSVQESFSLEEIRRFPAGQQSLNSILGRFPSVKIPPATEVTGGVSIDGASGAENIYIVDGREVTNQTKGNLSTNFDVPLELTQEVQVKSSGLNAEFGGATGGVISVVTQRGGDQLSGTFGIELNPGVLGGRARRELLQNSIVLSYITPPEDEILMLDPRFSFGGPIIKKRLWFYVGSESRYMRTKRSLRYPDGTLSPTYVAITRSDYSFLRLSGSVTNKLQIEGTYTYNPIKNTGALPRYEDLRASETGAGAPSSEAHSQQGGRTPSVGVTLMVTYTPPSIFKSDAISDLVLSARWSRDYLNEKFLSDGTAQSATAFCFNDGTPFGVACKAGQSFPEVGSFKTEKDISIRKSFHADISLAIKDFVGKHAVKTGYQRFDGFSDVNVGNIGVGSVSFLFPPEGFSFTPDGIIYGNRPGEIGTADYIETGTIGIASSSINAFYVQDSWQPVKNVTFNLGVRTERENVPSFSANAQAIKFDFGDKLAPRLGGAWDVRGNGKIKIFGNFGYYFDRFKYNLSRIAFGATKRRIMGVPILVSQRDLSAYNRRYFLNNSLFDTGTTVSENPVVPDLKPFRSTEYTVGAEFAFGLKTYVTTRYTHKQVDNAVESIGYIDDLQMGGVIIGNPGRGICAAIACGRINNLNLNVPAAKAERKYDAFEARLNAIDIKKGLDVYGSYTYSRLFGNYSGVISSELFSAEEFSQGANATPYFDIPIEGYAIGGKPNNGLLPTDIPHSVKIDTAYTLNRSSFIRMPENNELRLSYSFTFRSGTPVTTRVRIMGVSVPVFGRGDLGRTESVTQSALSLNYRYRFGRNNRFGIELFSDVFNLFDEKAVTARFENYSSQLLTLFDINSALSPADRISTQTDFIRAYFDGRITAQTIRDLVEKDLPRLDSSGNPIVVPGTGPLTEAIRKDVRFNQPFQFQSPRTLYFGFRFSF